jgi:NAD(P)-dependent dehydrogenase (short-subunit alcohol dehydrogenase family)
MAGTIDLRERVFVVTGGNSGIGLGVARGIARAGGAIAIWARRPDRTAEAVDELRSLGARAEGIVCDVADEGQVESSVAETIRRFGRLDGLVANAGTSSSAPFIEMSLEEWHRVITVNLTGAFLSLRAAARVLVQQGEGGSLVGVSSTSALHGAPRLEHYASSKTAMLGLMRALAVELARYRIRCNSLMPGWTVTDMTALLRQNPQFLGITTHRTPVRRWATEDDYEQVGAYLCDPTITFHTGDTLVVDGGYTVA